MTMTDPIADMLTRLRNANQAHHESVAMPYGKLNCPSADPPVPHSASYRYEPEAVLAIARAMTKTKEVSTVAAHVGDR